MDARADGSGSIKQEDHASGHWHNFPAGLRLLVVDDDPLCLKVVEQMLRKCSYEVTTCTNATMALNLLREKNTEYDLVLSDVYMPDMDGFKLLEVVGLEMDLPVIMMSSNGDTSNVLRGVTHGACDYLIKPVRLEELRNLWQHVVRRRRQHNLDHDSDELSQERDEDQSRNKRKADAAGFMSDQYRFVAGCGGGLCLNGGANGSLQAMAGVGGLGGVDDMGLENGANKKARVVWSVEMHQQFVNAVNQLGIDKAVPKKILEIMNVEGLTRENVASHLQKYRLYLKRVAGVQQPNGIRAAKPSPQQATPHPAQPQPQSPPVAAPASIGPQQQPQPQQQGSAAALLLPQAPQQQQPQAQRPGTQQLQPGALGPAGPTGMMDGPANAGGAGLNPAVAGAMSVAAAATGPFPGPHPPHPAALLAANPMMAAAAAGLNPLLGAMGSLGVGPLGPINPLNGLPMPPMQPPLGLLPGLSGAPGQAGLGPLGPMGLPGLPGLPGAMPLNPMAGGLQQMAATNLMSGMAAVSMGQLPALAMNGLMGGLTGGCMGLPGASPTLFPPPAASQPSQPQQGPQEPNGLGQQQQAHQHKQQHQHLHSNPHTHQASGGGSGQTQLQSLHGLASAPSQPLSATPTAAPTGASASGMAAQSSFPQLMTHGSLPDPMLASPKLHASPNGMGLGVSAGAGCLSANAGIGRPVLRPGSAPSSGPSGIGCSALADLPPDLMGGLMDVGFGPSAIHDVAHPVGGAAGPAGHGGGGAAAAAVSAAGGAGGLLDPAMLLDGDDATDIATVFHEMYGGSGGAAGGGMVLSGAGGFGSAPVSVGSGGGMLLGSGAGSLLSTPLMDGGGGALGLVGVDVLHGKGADDDFLSFLLKN